MKKDKINLCDDCYFHIATCLSEIKFGRGKGADNVVKCNIHEPIKSKLHEEK